jgi:NTE family protein
MSRWIVVLLLSTLVQQSVAQTRRIDNLVFEGAGIRGIAYSGAIKALAQYTEMNNIKRLGGTSAGAITALLLSIHYTPNEIEEIIGSTNYKKFNDGGIPLLGGIKRLRKNYGWYKGEKVERWLEKLIFAKTGNANISFAEIAQKYIPLYITGTSLSEQKEVLFSAESFPNMPVKNAVRISMSIPLYYRAVYMDAAGGIVKKPTKDRHYQVMIDGGFMNNFPIHIFDSTKYIDATTANTVQLNPYTIGFRVDRKNQIVLDKDSANTKLAAVPIKNIGSYLTAFLVLATERLNRQKLTPADWQRTISIADGDISPRVKGMPKKDIDTLVQNGFTATDDYFIKR